MLAAVLAVAAGAAAIATFARRDVPRLREPGLNVLLITVDTLRADALGAYGYRDAGTPWVDRLAADGVLFTRAHAHNVVTFPSHANILSGRYPLRHGVRDNAGFRFPAGMDTLATLLRAHGYHTAAFVSAFPLDSRFGLDRGFEVYDDRFGESGGPAVRLEHIPRRPGAETVSAARRWLRAQTRGPTFCWVHVYEPHWPYAPPEPFASRFPGNPYQGAVATADAALGPLLEPILSQGASGRTLIVFTADHGEALGDHDEITHGILAYEATLHIPLVLYAPRLFPARVVTEPVRHVDLLPTILEAVGLDLPAGTDGRSLLPLAAGRLPPAAATYFEALTAAATRGWAPLYGLIRGSEKYIDLPLPELYDLASDPREEKNLAASRPQDVARLRALLLDLRRSDPGLQRAEESPEALERLRALGYAGGGAPQKTRYTADDDPKRLMGLNTALSHVIGRYDAGDLPGALTLCREVVASRPTMPQALHYQAYLEWQLGRRDAAIETARRALALNTENTEVVARLGYFLAQAGRAREAAALLEPYSRRREPDVDVMTALAVAYASLGRTQDAVAVFARVLEIDPTNAMALLNQGRVLIQAGRRAEAREAFEGALRLDPSFGLAHVSLGLLASQDGRIEEALGEWRKALELDPHAYEALFNLGATLLQLGRIAEARPYVERYLREAPPTEAANVAQLRGLLATAARRGPAGRRDARE
ncbi:MAG TPA: sulfatase-like hydrolase/transferase [Vicinamibacteria bacterium]|nr:sulfatase-like hydrolase/transferase [Vicinamibacteria bacterium]